MNYRQNCIGRNMSIINKCLKIFLKKRFSTQNLSANDVMILLIINKSEGISQEGIIEHLGYDKAVLTRRINKLEQSAFIIRQRSETDKRAYKLHLSKKGTEKMPEIFNALQEWNTLITAGIPEETVELISKKMEIMAHNAQNGEIK